MSIVKPEQHKNELDVFLCRNEGGIQAMRSWLYSRRERINTEWIGMVGDELTREQGEARLVAKLIRMIDDGPTIKPTLGVA